MPSDEVLQAKIVDAFFKLHLEDGDIVFFDPNVIDLSMIKQIPDPLMRNITMVAVSPLIGHSLKESVVKIGRSDLQRLLQFAGGVTSA